MARPDWLSHRPQPPVATRWWPRGLSSLFPCLPAPPWPAQARAKPARAHLGPKRHSARSASLCCFSSLDPDENRSAAAGLSSPLPSPRARVPFPRDRSPRTQASPSTLLSAGDLVRRSTPSSASSSSNQRAPSSSSSPFTWSCRSHKRPPSPAVVARAFPDLDPSSPPAGAAFTVQIHQCLASASFQSRTSTPSSWR